MRRKITVEEICDGFLNLGLTLLETKYVNSKAPMLYRCSAGHEGRTTWNIVQRGSGCAKCAGTAKPTIEEVRDGFLNQGLTLLETKYVNSKTPMRYRCSAGHDGKIVWNSVQRGSGCAKCASKAKLTIEKVRDGFLSQGLTLLEAEYVNSKTPMRYRCSAGHEGKIRWNSVQKGNSCAQCAVSKAKLTIEKVRDGFLNQGWILLETEYVDSNTPMRYRCAAGHEGKMTWNGVRQGNSCSQCAVSKAKLTIEEVREGFLNRGLTLLETEYVDSNTPMRYCCSAGHEGKIRWGSVQQGHGCDQCAVYGFKSSKPGMLYYVRIYPENHTPLYKIGITNGTVKKRFSTIIKSYKPIQTWKYDIGQDAYDREQELLTKYSDQRVPVEIGRRLVQSGYTELFYSDILGLDLSSKQPAKRSPTKASLELHQLALW